MGYPIEWVGRPTTRTSMVAINAEDEEDEFGDFVDVGPKQTATPTAQVHTAKFPPGYVPGLSLIDAFAPPSTVNQSFSPIDARPSISAQNANQTAGSSNLPPENEVSWKSSSNANLAIKSEKTDLDGFGEFDSFESGLTISSPADILQFYYKHVFHVLDDFFAKMVSLTYSQRRRVLAHAKTKAFFSNYYAVVRVAGMVLLGRKRTALDSTQLTNANRMAKDVVWLWNQLCQRLRTMGISQPLPILDDSTVLPKAYDGEICKFCGLGKAEKPLNDPGTSFAWTYIKDQSFRGHVQCYALWKNKSAFGADALK